MLLPLKDHHLHSCSLLVESCYSLTTLLELYRLQVSGDTRSDTEEETSEEEEEKPGEKSHQNGVANDFKKKQ